MRDLIGFFVQLARCKIQPMTQTTTSALSPSSARADLHSTALAIREGRSSAAQEMQRSIDIAQSSACANTFMRLDASAALTSARQTQADLPLAGLAISVKDLYDMAGQVTAAGSNILANAAPALADAPAVARLKAAGGVILGRTNMVEFAFGGVGCNPHYGTPVNPCDTVVARIPGGSSSGAAVSVATGAAFVGLGSDTGGSIRIPAALCGLVGFKPTARTVPTEGALPLSTTLDTVCAMTRSVRDAITVHEVLSASAVPVSAKPLSSYKLAVARSTMLDGMDATVTQAFARTLATLRAAGAQITEIDLNEIADLGQVQSRGGFSPPEAQAWHRAQGLWPEQRSGYDPRVAVRIALADSMTASDYVRLLWNRQAWIARTERALAGFDGVLSPTVPIAPPPIDSVAPALGQDAALDTTRDAEYWRVNALLLRNTSVVNLLDGCAISLPCHIRGELPVGLMLWHGAMHDNTVLQIAQQIESVLTTAI
jgi:aspartyl-tRNA(Asn)/glutamyl-tRNA(Gln) amidotransferase subunit A